MPLLADLGQALDALAGSPLAELSSSASISSRIRRGERLTRETTTPGTSSSSTSWSTRANVMRELVVGVRDVREVRVDARP